MTKEEIDRILDTANFLLRSFPYEDPRFGTKKSPKRKPHLRAKYIQNRKVFFNILKHKYIGLNKRDKARRYEIVPSLREILKNEIPVREGNFYIYSTIKRGKRFMLIVKDIRRKNRLELYLYSIYPK